MEHEPEPEKKPASIGKIIVRIVIGAVVLFVAAVAFVFGACLLG
jgi:hypothetical protein